MKNSKIEWTHHTFNPWIGCTKVSPACDNCYAAVSTPARTMKINWGAGQPRKRTSQANWREPLRWNADCEKLGVRARVFCASLADVFDNEVPTRWRADLLELIAKTPHLDWLLLTKRIGNANRMLNDAMDTLSCGLTEWGDPIWPNVWLGATICNQEEADRDIPKLLQVPAAKRFLSIEPLLGPVDLTQLNKDQEINEINCLNAPTWAQEIAIFKELDSIEWVDDFQEHFGVDVQDVDPEAAKHPIIDWVIAGGESGPNARPMHPDWARSLRDQCQAAGVPFFFKQWGEWTPGVNVSAQSGSVQTAKWFDSNWTFGIEDLSSSDNHIDDEPDLYRIGKKAAGRMLDGREWNEIPTPIKTSTSPA